MASVYRVYVLQNSAKKFYVGLSDDLQQRLEQHNLGESRWTRSRGPWVLVWRSEELSLSNARRLENQLKRQGRGQGFYSITGLHRFSSS